MKYNSIILKFSIIIILSMIIQTAFAQNHPTLILTKSGVEMIKNSKVEAPLFNQVLEATKAEVDAEIELGIFVPVPKDMAGGYTHERHKLNFFIMQKAGNLFQITGDEKYAIYIRDMLMEYAELYPKLGIHPTNKSYATGKIFWQSLNDANWLVYTSQAYDCIYDWLKKKEVKHLNKKLFRPFADYISVESPQFFNRVHNHSTWGNAAVGMIGIVMDDEELIKRALYGLDKDDLDENLMDNDGGLIKLKDKDGAGFFAQLDHAFSPDGYYTEGPYYQRYAISPFILFAKALENNRPDVKIFEYRNGLLKKGVYALLYQTNTQGEFFPINDAQKGMSFRSRELIAAVDIVYDDCGNEPQLLSVAQKQGEVTLDASGFAVARDIALGKAKSFGVNSVELTDGKDGDEGALGILRSANDVDELTLLYKYTSQGLGHGHFDKLGYVLYDKHGEVIQDYGAARWVNIDQKGGGRYLKENKTWAKQTIAHNTMVVNEKSHFGGKFKVANDYHSEGYIFDTKNKDFLFVSAKDFNAYSDVELHRSMALFQDETFEKPVVIDVFRVSAKTENQYDLPLWFQGHLLNADFEYESVKNSMNTLGEAHGYQHLWKTAEGKSASGTAQISWFEKGHFYTMVSAVDSTDALIFGRVGANDPEFNLRPDPCFIIRKKGQKDAIFVSVIEPHGDYSTVTETPNHPYGELENVAVLHSDNDYTAVSWSAKNGKSWTLIISNQNNDENATHTLSIGDKKHEWKGGFVLIEN